MTGDNRDPVTCGRSIGFDGIYVCGLEQLPCPAVKTCPLLVDYRALADSIIRLMDGKERKK